MQRQFLLITFIFSLATLVTSVFAVSDDGASTTPKDAYMQATISPKSPYVKAEAIYILKLFYNRAIQRPSFTEPKAAESTIFLLGREKTYRQVVNGTPYQVLEQRYAIVPNKSGMIQIKGPTLTGQIRKESNSQYNYYKPRWENFKISANDITMKVKPALSNINPWLPAREFKLVSEWSTKEQKINVGEPVTLTVSMYTNGVMGEQLPDLSQWDIPGIQTYSDKADVVTTSDSANLLGQRIDKIAFLPQKSGEITIPAKHIRWLNTKTGHLETATIPSKTFNVVGAIAPPQSSTPMTTTVQTIVQPAWYSNIWLWTTLGMVLICLSTMAYYQKRLQLHQAPSETEITLKPEQKHAWKAVKKACMTNNTAIAGKTLLAAAKQEWPNEKITNLRDLATLLNDETFGEHLTTIEEMLYKGSGEVWQGKSFWDALQKAKARFTKVRKAPGKSAEMLSTLYPE